MRYLFIGFILLFALTKSYSQENSWQFVNPWDFTESWKFKESNNFYSFIERKNSDGDFLINYDYLSSSFDTLFHENGIYFFDFAIFNDKKFYILTNLSNGDKGIYEIDIVEGIIKVVYSSEYISEIEAFNNKLFILETEDGFNTKIVKLENEEIIEVFPEKTFYPAPIFEVENGILLLYNRDEFHYSMDFGETWLFNQSDISTYNINIIDNRLVVMGSESRLDFYNLDGSINNSIYFNGLNGTQELLFIYDLKELNSIYYLATDKYFVKSEDFGITWEEINEPSSRTVGTVFEMAVLPNEKLLVKSINRFEEYDLKNENYKRLNHNGIYSGDFVTIINDSTYLIYQTTDYKKGQFYLSNDRGITWSQIHKNLNLAGGDFHYISEDTFFISSVIDDDVKMSVDGGNSWNEIYKFGLNDNGFYKNEFFTILDEFEAYRIDDSLSVSLDGFMSWTKIPEPPGYVLHNRLKSRYNHIWLLYKNGNAYILKSVKNGNVINQIEFESSAFITKFKETKEGLIIRAEKINLVDNEFNYIEDFLEINNEFTIVDFVGDKVILQYLDDTYLYSYKSNSPEFIKQSIDGGPMYHNYNAAYEDDKNGILLTTRSGMLLKYGPKIDKSIFVNNEEIFIDKEEKLTVFPIPFRDILRIDSDKQLQHDLFDSSGQLIFSSTSNILNTIDLVKGVYYLLSYEKSGKRYVTKIVKQ